MKKLNQRRINMTKSKITDLEKILGITFGKKEYLQMAVTHRSFLNEHKEETVGNNERLEFLGDAVLELIISDYLYQTYPEYPEGDLTSFRSAIVRTESLADASRELNAGSFLRMSKGEEESGGADKDYLLANTYESLLGAIYVDKGYKEAKDFVFRTLVPKIEEIVESRSDIDSKTKIQEIVQSKFKVTPTYDVIKEEGPDHDKKFVVGVKINEKIVGKGKGPSKQKAEEDAATNGIKFLLKKYSDLE
jgi:ribonuclease-3